MEEENKEKQWDPCHKTLISQSIMEQQTFSNVNFKNNLICTCSTYNIIFKYRNLIF